MKFLKGLLYFVLILLVAALLAALFAPGSKTIERSIIIGGSKDKIFSQVANFENWTKWDPWYTKDTNQTRTYKGTLGDDGYGYTWKSSNKDVGEGRMQMVSVEGKEKLNYQLVFKNRNSEEKAEGSFSFEERDSKTKVSWSMVSKMPYPMKIMNYFMEGWIGPDFEKGLENLKFYIENSADQDLNIESMGIQIITEQGVNYAIVKSDNLEMTKMANFFATSYPQIYGYIQTNGLAPKGPSRVFYYNWDEDNKTTTLAAAVPISELLIEESYDVELESGKAQVKPQSIEYILKGGYSGLKNSHNALDKWLETNNKEMESPVIEEYIKGPNDTQDTSEFETKIIYMFK
ncbi:MAG: SRPBCC family protein [Bacteroidia bacterium]|nr:SRPBCC family protein [Bacteroidia bacterium]NNJ56491.1 hypothetical protein [Bacteroidia bacterium]